MLKTFTIYKNPSDHPDKYVVREFNVSRLGAVPCIDTHSVSDNLESARKTVPQGLTLITRNDDDPPQIVECWV